MLPPKGNRVKVWNEFKVWLKDQNIYTAYNFFNHGQIKIRITEDKTKLIIQQEGKVK